MLARARPYLQIAAVAACVLSTSSALADTVLVIVASDNASFEDPVRMQAEELVQKQGLVVRPFGEAVVESGVNPAEILRCVDKQAECIAEASKAANADRLLIFRLSGDSPAGSNPRVVITGWLFDGRSGERLQGGQRFCERCGDLKALVGLAEELGTELFTAAAAKASPDTFLEIHVTPARAVVRIDGEAVASSGQPVRVSPGTHEVEVELDGYTSIAENVAAEANQTTIRRIALQPTAPPGDSSWMLRWGTAGAGALVTTIGIAWIAVDGPQSDGGLRQPERRNTLVPGVIATTVGVGLLAASGYLFYKKYGSEPKASVTAAATDGGGLLGIAGRF